MLFHLWVYICLTFSTLILVLVVGFNFDCSTIWYLGWDAQSITIDVRLSLLAWRVGVSFQQMGLLVVFQHNGGFGSVYGAARVNQLSSCPYILSVYIDAKNSGRTGSTRWFDTWFLPRSRSPIISWYCHLSSNHPRKRLPISYLLALCTSFLPVHYLAVIPIINKKSLLQWLQYGWYSDRRPWATTNATRNTGEVGSLTAVGL